LEIYIEYNFLLIRFKEGKESMEIHYSSEKNVQMLIALMKKNKIKKVIASPGTTNIAFVASVQNDSWFEVYSSVDERSAAYMACGLAAESGESVALSCTGATASRNYIPGLTEAYYRRLPVLAITSTQHPGRIGNYMPQVIDRTVPLNDIVVYSTEADIPSTPEDEWTLNVHLNKAMIALRKNGGGPVHINLMTSYSKDFSVKELPAIRGIRHIGYHDTLPKLKKGRVGVFVGNHEKWDEGLTKAVDEFCELYDAVVICDHTSNYHGIYKVEPSLVCEQLQYDSPYRKMSVMIYIGYVSGASMSMKSREVWRVNPDGEIRDNSKKTSYVFQMAEEDFFRSYVRIGKQNDVEHGNQVDTSESFLEQWKRECARIDEKVPDLPFSNAWLAQNTASKLPEGSVLHLGILNTLRTWNFCKLPDSVCAYSNTGGFGIDGDISSLLGASLASPDKLFFGVFGDLAFFYDMNVLGNRHFGKNVRMILVNNGRGTEFRNFNHPAARFGEDADSYMAGAGHYGNQSPDLVRHYATDLGFEYMSASNKEDYLSLLPRFLTKEITDRPMLLEVFTDSMDESHALEILYNLQTSAKGTAKKIAKDVIGEKGVATIKGIIKK
jgi:2-succinyl-5-enolpyruvyl-6-hydroxy-3-cyclohexene-1-carboxylate synthase